jgi:hypothetical protein
MTGKLLYSNTRKASKISLRSTPMLTKEKQLCKNSQEGKFSRQSPLFRPSLRLLPFLHRLQIPSLRNGRALPFAILVTMYLPAEFSSKHKAITSSVSKTGKKIRVTGSALKA